MINSITEGTVILANLTGGPLNNSELYFRCLRKSNTEIFLWATNPINDNYYEWGKYYQWNCKFNYNNKSYSFTAHIPSSTELDANSSSSDRQLGCNFWCSDKYNNSPILAYYVNIYGQIKYQSIKEFASKLVPCMHITLC